MVKAEQKKKIAKIIKVDADKCNGCRVCEMICSSSHAQPKYGGINPARSRIRVVRDPFTDRFVPVYATEYTKAACVGRHKYTIDGKEYDECTFCGASCPSRDLFKEPDSGLPLKCDMCEGEEEPLCVKWCYYHALTCEEREEQIEEEEKEVKRGEIELAYELLVKEHGKKKVMDTFARLSKKE